MLPISRALAPYQGNQGNVWDRKGKIKRNSEGECVCVCVYMESKCVSMTVVRDCG